MGENAPDNANFRVALTRTWVIEVNPDTYSMLVEAYAEGDSQMLDEAFGAGFDGPESESLERLP